MSNNKFGNSSQRRVNNCHPDLKLILETAIKVSAVDFGISDTLRSDEDQLKYFLEGKSRIDPRVPELRAKSKHLANEQGLSEAADFFAWVPGFRELMDDTEHLSYIAGVIQATAKLLYKQGKVGHLIRWGGNWDMDGCIVKDQDFDDLLHVELYKP